MKLSILFPPNTCIYKTRTKKLLTKGHTSAQRPGRRFIRAGVSSALVCTASECPCRGDGRGLCGDRERQIGTIDPHQRFSLFDEVAGVHQTLDHFTRYSKAQIALHPRSNHTGEGALRRAHRLNRCHLHKLNVGPWIRFFRRRFTRGEGESR